ncbi:DUF2145 domain-containing protein [Roseateles terrae]|uniref:DUF2145 domain-containing protein n=1 Tax=Roseateles terrae TaxID=431060 RepID=A0ABR6GN23_9BURK|nr:DUF2145 domain-containing protein [Roseateles terrae]MBB3193111.1 hypothetical protein [Roseateles terrae]OWQ89658.1 hypothetical protein CDN98_03825 [Roseateles terrae]
MSAMAAIAVAVCMLAAPGVARAGRPCEETALTADQVRNGLALAQATAEALDKSGAQVVLLARAGQNLDEYGLRWSHVGFVYLDVDPAGKPVWRVMHKLNECGTAQADLYRQGLAEFFMDRPYRLEGAFSVLKPQLQEALLPVLKDNARAATLHTPAYSMLAYPWAQQYQQSNQWALETLAGAAAPGEVFNRPQAQQWLKAAGYQPTDLRISTAKRLGARIGMANVAFDDHPSARRYSGHIDTTTADTIFQWLSRTGWGAAPTVVRAPR